MGEFAAAEYPADLPVEQVGDILTSLGSFMEAMIQPEFSTKNLLPAAFDQKIMRFQITDTAREVLLVSAADTAILDEMADPLKSARQLVLYAAKSGHTINNLSIADEQSEVGAMDFSKYIGEASGKAELSDEQTAEIIKYCYDMLAEHKDTELYILSDTVMAFAICERYSEDSLLGFVSFFEKGEDEAYRLKAVIDFNC